MAQVIIDYDEYQKLLEQDKLIKRMIKTATDSQRVVKDDPTEFEPVIYVSVSEDDVKELIRAQDALGKLKINLVR